MFKHLCAYVRMKTFYDGKKRTLYILKKQVHVFMVISHVLAKCAVGGNTWLQQTCNILV